MKRKAQTEIVGFVFIVLIVTVIMLFYVTYSVTSSDESKEVLDEYRYTEVAFSFVQALLYTSDCNTNMEGLLRDCAKFKELNCNGNTSCEQINSTVNYLLTKTLDEWSLEYSFVIDFDNNYNLTYNTSNCHPGKLYVDQATPAIFPLHLIGGQDIVLRLGICG